MCVQEYGYSDWATVWTDWLGSQVTTPGSLGSVLLLRMFFFFFNHFEPKPSHVNKEKSELVLIKNKPVSQRGKPFKLGVHQVIQAFPH